MSSLKPTNAASWSEMPAVRLICCLDPDGNSFGFFTR